MSQTKIGVVGLGAIAKNMHLPILSSFADVEIVAVSEVDVQRGRDTVKKWGIESVYSDFNQMYAEARPDGVFICLPNSLHYRAVRAALEHGIHVFCEKPMGLNSDGAYELVALSKKQGLKLAVGYNRRLEANFVRTRKVVESLKLGRILQFHAAIVNPGPYASWIPSSDWFFKDRYGVLFDTGSHLVDLITYILDDEIVEVAANGTSTMHGIEVYDNITGSMKTRKGVVGTFNTGWRMSANFDAFNIYGTGGATFANSMEVDERYGNYTALDRVAYSLKLPLELVSKEMKNMGANGPSGTYFLEDRAFVDAVQGRGEPIVTGAQGLKTIEILEAVKASIDSGMSVRVHSHELA